MTPVTLLMRSVVLSALLTAGLGAAEPRTTKASPGLEKLLSGKDVVRLAKPSDLRNAARSMHPGQVLLLPKGTYRHTTLDKINGTKDKPIIIASDPASPACFTGRNLGEGLHLVRCNYVTIFGIKVTGARHNGINADDGGELTRPARGIVLEACTVERTGPRGNRDGIKLSGLKDFIVRRCTVRGWCGSAIDMVGCHDGVIEDCQFEGLDGFSQSSGIQVKGGSTKVVVRRCFFLNAGGRPVNLGGSTGEAFFRPRVTDYEARDIRVIDNRFVGGQTGVAFVTSQGGIVRNNLFYCPRRWVLRILQEKPVPKFKRCSGGVFANNMIVYDGKALSRGVNVGPNTLPATFTFRNNAWFDLTGRRKLQLPGAEKNDPGRGGWQIDPKLARPKTRTSRITSTDPRLKNIGPRS